MRVYKQLKMAERAYRTIKDALDVRPIRHHLEDRVHAHFFLFLLAYYLLFELQARLEPGYFTDDTPIAPTDPVAPAKTLPGREHQGRPRLYPHGLPAFSLADLIAELGTVCRNQLRIGDSPHTFPAHQPQHRPGQSARPARRHPRQVAKAKPARNTRIPRQHAGFVISQPKTSG